MVPRMGWLGRVQRDPAAVLRELFPKNKHKTTISVYVVPHE